MFWELRTTAARGHRADRGDQRPGRHALRPQCGQRRDQHHHAATPARRSAAWSAAPPAAASGRSARATASRSATTGAIRFYGNWFDREDLPRRPIGPDVDDALPRLAGAASAPTSAGADDISPSRATSSTTTSDGLPGDGDRGHNLLARWTPRPDRRRSSFQRPGLLRLFRAPLPARRRFAADLRRRGPVQPRAAARTISSSGGGVRTTRDEFVNNLNPFRLDPPSRRLWIFNAFVQDRIALTPSSGADRRAQGSRRPASPASSCCRTCASPGSPTERTLLWAAVSRAVRTPSRIDRQLEFLPLLAARRPSSSLGETDRLRGRLSRPADAAGRRCRSRSSTISTTTSAPPSSARRRAADPADATASRATATASRRGAAPSSRPGGGSTSASPRSARTFELKPGQVDLAAAAIRSATIPISSCSPAPRWTSTDRLRLNAGPALGRRDRQRAARSAPMSRPTRGLAYRLNDRLELYRRRPQPAPRTHLESNDVRARPARPAQPLCRHEAAVLKPARRLRPRRLCSALALARGAGARAADRGSGEGGLPAQVRPLRRAGRPRRCRRRAAPFQLCVIGRDPFGRLLDRAAAGELIDGHRRRRAPACTLAGAAPAATSPSSRARRRRIPAGCCSPCAASRSSPSPTPAPAPQRGMIHFTIVGGRVRFFIDEAAAAERGLTISSRLLALAAGVRQRRS